MQSMSTQEANVTPAAPSQAVTQLARDMKLFDITMVGVGAMIGAGIFALTGIAAGIAAGLVVSADVAIVAVTMSTVRPTVDDVVIGEDAWLDAIRNVAAADTVAAILAILLAVLVFRMPLDRWARGLVGAIAITAAVLATGTAAGSAGTLDFLQSERPVVVPRGWTGGTSLDLGRTPDGGMASIDRSLDAKPVLSRRISPVERITVPGTMSIAELVAAPIPD